MRWSSNRVVVVDFSHWNRASLGTNYSNNILPKDNKSCRDKISTHVTLKAIRLMPSNVTYSIFASDCIEILYRFRWTMCSSVAGKGPSTLFVFRLPKWPTLLSWQEKKEWRRWLAQFAPRVVGLLNLRMNSSK